EMLLLQHEQINQFRHKEPGELALMNKLTDLYYIYEKLTIALQNSYIDNEDQLQLLAEKIKESSMLDNAEVYVDGFHRFTPTELLVIETLMNKCKQMTIALTVDDPESDAVSELDLFFQTTETYHVLKQI